MSKFVIQDDPHTISTDYTKFGLIVYTENEFKEKYNLQHIVES